MSDIVAHLQEDLRGLQQLLTKLVNAPQTAMEDDRRLLEEKSIYLENTYTLEELQAEGLQDVEIINCLAAVGVFLGYSDLVKGDPAGAIDHFIFRGRPDCPVRCIYGKHGRRGPWAKSLWTALPDV